MTDAQTASQEDAGANEPTDATGQQLKSYIERIEKLEEEKQNLQADIREIYSEAKANGFDTKVMRQLIRLRAQDPNDRSEQEELLDTYKNAIGME